MLHDLIGDDDVVLFTDLDVVDTAAVHAESDTLQVVGRRLGYLQPVHVGQGCQVSDRPTVGAGPDFQDFLRPQTPAFHGFSEDVE